MIIHNTHARVAHDCAGYLSFTFICIIEPECLCVFGCVTVTSTTYKFLLINVYMPYEDDDGQTDLFVEELSRVEASIVNNSDYHVRLFNWRFQC
jgi:hypothetical protein